MDDIKFPSMNLKGKIAIITGSGQGLGLWMALGLAHVGSDIVISDVNSETGKLAAEKVQKMGRRSLFIETDVTRVDSIRAMVDRVVSHWGRIDILINNAGISNRTKIEEATVEEFDRAMAINLRGVFFCAQAVGKVMMRQRQGKIINIASAAGLLVRSGFYNSIYATTKAGVIMLTKALAVEWAPFNINVNAVAPGFFPTLMTRQRVKDPQALKVVMDFTPLRRMGEAGDIIGPIVFLASEAAAYITGVCLSVDGGRTAL